MAKTKTDLERYTQTLKYIRDKVDTRLATKVAARALTDTKREELGALLSLGKGQSKWTLIGDQHHAVRALLLCQKLFLKPGYWDPGATKTFFKSKSETDVKAAVKIYVTKQLVTLNEFKKTAELVSYKPGQNDLRTITRQSLSFCDAANCYGAVNIWLVKSGLCSLDWLINLPCDAYNVNAVIGNGAIYAKYGAGITQGMDQLHTIPPGYIFNIHDADDQNICHWGVVLGPDKQGVTWAAASNTTPGAPVPHTTDIKLVQFKTAKDNGTYGHFTLASAIEVCAAKYNSGKVFLRALDPTTGLQYY